MKRLLAYLFIVLGLGLVFSVNANAASITEELTQLNNLFKEGAITKEEFSEAATKPIKHNPETKTIKNKVEFAKGKMGATALDRVLSKLNK